MKKRKEENPDLSINNSSEVIQKKLHITTMTKEEKKKYVEAKIKENRETIRKRREFRIAISNIKDYANFVLAKKKEIELNNRRKDLFFPKRSSIIWISILSLVLYRSIKKIHAGNTLDDVVIEYTMQDSLQTVPCAQMKIGNFLSLLYWAIKICMHFILLYILSDLCNRIRSLFIYICTEYIYKSCKPKIDTQISIDKQKIIAEEKKEQEVAMYNNAFRCTKRRDVVKTFLPLEIQIATRKIRLKKLSDSN